jgi:hypothetical protein
MKDGGLKIDEPLLELGIVGEDRVFSSISLVVGRR